MFLFKDENQQRAVTTNFNRINVPMEPRSGMLSDEAIQHILTSKDIDGTKVFYKPKEGFEAIVLKHILVKSLREEIGSHAKLVKEREQARASKNFKLADELRDELKKHGIAVEDTPNGQRWKRILSK